MSKYAAAVHKAALGWLMISIYGTGTEEEVLEDFGTVATMLADGLGKDAAAVYRDIYEEFTHLPKPQILQLLTLMEVSGTLNT